MSQTNAKAWLARIRDLGLPRPVKIMSVCGGHERSISLSGIRGALPPGVEIIPGPGCPVCVCPEEDLHDVIRLALEEDTLCWSPSAACCACRPTCPRASPARWNRHVQPARMYAPSPRPRRRPPSPAPDPIVV